MMIPCVTAMAKQVRKNSVSLTLLDRFEIGEDRPDLIGLENEFGHVGMADGNAFRQGLGKALDRVLA